MFLWIHSIRRAGEPLRGKRKAAARPETEEIRFEPPKPGLEFMARFEVNLDAPVLELGWIESLGRRRIIPITGGKFTGPLLNGRAMKIDRLNSG